MHFHRFIFERKKEKRKNKKKKRKKTKKNHKFIFEMSLIFTESCLNEDENVSEIQHFYGKTKIY